MTMMILEILGEKNYICGKFFFFFFLCIKEILAQLWHVRKVDVKFKKPTCGRY